MIRVNKSVREVNYLYGGGLRLVGNMVTFKALTVKNNSREFNEVWVEGDLIHSKGKTYIHPISNAVTVKGDIGRLIIMHEVKPETVRQVN